MGLFSGSKLVSVSSTAYNLAGPEDKRPNYLKTSVASGLLTPERSLTDTITHSYLGGPGIGFRNFGRWAVDSGYDTLIGLGTTGQLTTTSGIDVTVLAPLLPVTSGKTPIVQTAEVGNADYSYWVDQYMVMNHVDLLGTNYSADFDGTTITINFADFSVESFVPTGFDPTKQYLYVGYSQLGSTDTMITDFQIFIYQQGSGIPALDAFFTAPSGGGEYLPFIPLRVDNKFVSTSYLNDVYPQAKKALKKSIKANYDDLIAKLADNAHLSDIDYAYVVFGVSLNTKEIAARRYIYEFFKQAMLGQDTTAASTVTWLAAIANINSKRIAYKNWLDAQQDPTNPLYGTAEPADTITSGDFLAYPPPPSYSVRIKSTTRAVMGFDMIVTWSGVAEVSTVGLGKDGAKVGDIWFEVEEPDSVPDMFLFTSATDILTAFGRSQEKITMKWQTEANLYKSLTLYGLVHENYIYDGRSVDIKAGDALADASESGFIIPLNTALYNSLPLTVSTQMSTACSYLVVNAYQVKKVAWYASGFFQVFITIVVIVIAVAITVYTGGAAAPGILGAAGTVGATFGATGTAAVIIGAAVNAIAAMIVVQIISRVSTSLFGAKIGAIVGAIASVIAVASVSNFMSESSSIALFDQLSSSENLLKLTSSILNGASDFMKAGDQTNLVQAENNLNAINAMSKDIQSKYEEQFSPNMVIDPLSLTDTFRSMFVESPDDFFNRTLMSGSDIAGLSMDMISKFTDMTITNYLP